MSYQTAAYRPEQKLFAERFKENKPPQKFL